MQRITPCLCFNTQAEQAVKFYTSLFEDSRILTTTYWCEQELTALNRVPEVIRPGPVGGIRSIRFVMLGHEYIAVNGGAHFTFNDGISFMVHCETQQELDNLWDNLTDGGEELECGWLKDRFGIYWQIVPNVLEELTNDPDMEKSQRVRAAVLQSKKLDIRTLLRAHSG